MDVTERRASAPSVEPGGVPAGTAEPGSATGDGAPLGGAEAGSDGLDVEILDGLEAVLTSLVAQAEQVARQFGVPAFFLKALHVLDCPMAMKDLGRRMHCDPSFVTGIADMMEKRGLATRESDPSDRRIKRLALTPAGVELKRQVESEVLARAPWRRTLDSGERRCLLGLIRKILPAATGEPSDLVVRLSGRNREGVSESMAPTAGAGH